MMLNILERLAGGLAAMFWLCRLEPDSEDDTDLEPPDIYEPDIGEPVG